MRDGNTIAFVLDKNSLMASLNMPGVMDIIRVLVHKRLPLDKARELAQRLVGAVEALPLEQRGAFVMFTQGGLSLEEIALATGVAVETAKSRLRYARARLRQTLASERSAHV